MYESYEHMPISVSTRGIATSGSAALDESPIDAASQAIAARLTDLDAAIAAVETRLSRVLRPLNQPVSGETLAAVPHINSDHVSELRKHADFACHLRDRITTLLDRLDV
jgi:hypothetical protein